MKKRGLPLLLCFALLFGMFGCAPKNSSSPAQSAPPASEAEPNSGGTEAEVSGGGLFTPETVEQIPEMKEIHFRTALCSEIYRAFGVMEEITAKGANALPLRESYGVASMLDYAMWFYEQRSTQGYAKTDSNPLLPGHEFTYSIEPEYLQPVVEGVFADEIFADRATDIFETQSNSGLNYYFSRNGDGLDCDILSFGVEWFDNGPQRTVLVTPAGEGNPYYEKIRLEYNYTKGSDGQYRLAGGKQYYLEFGIPLNSTANHDIYGAPNLGAPESVTRLPNGLKADAIVGSVGETILSFDYRNDKLVITALGWDDFLPCAELIVDGAFLRYRLFEDDFLLFYEDRVLKIDASLQIVEEQPLPAFLIGLMNRDFPEQYDNLQEGEELIAFYGYDVTHDFTQYLYSTEEGTFVYNTRTGKNTMYYEGNLLGRGPMGGYPFALWEPRFCYDESIIVGKEPVYEGNSPYFYYKVATGEMYEIGDPDAYPDEEDVSVLIRPEHATMGDYMNRRYYAKAAPFFGLHHYVAFDDDALRVGLLTDESAEDARVATPAFAPEEKLGEDTTFKFGTVLGDGRVIFSFGNEYYREYFCSQPYESLAG